MGSAQRRGGGDLRRASCASCALPTTAGGATNADGRPEPRRTARAARRDRRRAATELTGGGGSLDLRRGGHDVGQQGGRGHAVGQRVVDLGDEPRSVRRASPSADVHLPQRTGPVERRPAISADQRSTRPCRRAPGRRCGARDGSRSKSGPRSTPGGAARAGPSRRRRRKGGAGAGGAPARLNRSSSSRPGWSTGRAAPASACACAASASPCRGSRRRSPSAAPSTLLSLARARDSSQGDSPSRNR